MTKYNSIIIRWGELALKGRNRSKFENALVKDCVNSIFHELNNPEVDKNTIRKYFWKTRSKLYLFLNELYELEAITAMFDSEEEFNNKIIIVLKHIYGVSSISPGIRVIAEDDKIKSAIDELLKNREYESFRVTCKRSTKDFKLSSNQANMIFGEYVFEKYKKKVSLKEFDINIQIEIDKNAYLSIDKIVCANGLPLGVSGSINIPVFSEDLETLYNNSMTEMSANIVETVKQLSKRGCAVYILIDDNKDEKLLLDLKEEIESQLKSVYLSSKVKVNILVLTEAIKDYNNIGLYYNLNEILNKKGQYFQVNDTIKSNLTLFPLI